MSTTASQLLQKQLTINDHVTIRLKTGQEIEGLVTELDAEYIVLNHDSRLATVLVDTIGSWELLRKSTATPMEPGVPSQHVQTEKITEPSVLKKMVTIEAKYGAKIESARLTMITPDFSVPVTEFSGRRKEEALRLWSRVTEKYKYAEKIQETHPKFGRIQVIVGDLEILVNWYPTSSLLKEHLAFCLWVMNNRSKALDLYRQALVGNSNPAVWINTAALSLETDPYLACYTLERLFIETGKIESELEAWYIYLRLVQALKSYDDFGKWIQTKLDKLSKSSIQVIFESVLFLLISQERKNAAEEILLKEEGVPPTKLVGRGLALLTSESDAVYQERATQLKEEFEVKPVALPIPTTPQGEGAIFSYNPAKRYGFLRATSGGRFFFHRSAVADDELLALLNDFSYGNLLPVVFTTTEGPKGPLAVDVMIPRTVHQMYELAVKYADDGDYPKAIAQIKRVLAQNPQHVEAQRAHEKWRDDARFAGLPRGTNPYARAKRVQLIEKDLERAEQLFRVAIQSGDSVESAIKDLASLLAQLNRTQEAIDLLQKYRNTATDPRSIDNMLIGYYSVVGEFDAALEILERNYEKATTPAKKAQILWVVANIYLRKREYGQAELSLRKLLQSQPENNAANRNLAISLFKQNRLDEAEQVLNGILKTIPDSQSAQLLEAISEARTTGQSQQIDNIIIETTLTDLSRQISGFGRFILDRADFKGVQPERVQTQNFRTSDVKQLEELATRLGTSRPRDRAGYYLAAAKIISILEEGENPNHFYKYLCRSFASMGDACIIENNPPDSAREFYCEALVAIDNAQSRSGDEQDATNSLVRYLFLTLGASNVPLRPNIPSIDETIDQVFSKHPQRNRLFDAVAYLVFRSGFAANRILNRIYAKSTFQAIALEYLKTHNIPVRSPIRQFDTFVNLWNDLRREKFGDWDKLAEELRFMQRLELTTAWLENALTRINPISHLLFFDLDQHRISQLQQLLETILDLCKQSTFEEQERLCIQIQNRCQDLLREIESNPTRVSIEELYPIFGMMMKKVSARLDELYEMSTPQIQLRLPMESYTPDNTYHLDVQVVASNRMGCSPAESLELVIPLEEEDNMFAITRPEIKIEGSLRGGEQKILTIPIQISEYMLQNETFSLPVYALYKTRSGETVQTPVDSFSIRLYSPKDFIEIANPYAAYAEGGVVDRNDMFYGRTELIENVANAIAQSESHSKCVVIFGQKRAGKSSILYHLKSRLQANAQILVLDVGNIGSLMDEYSRVPLLYQILWSILTKLQTAIDDRVEAGFTKLEIEFQTDREFYEHPSPLILFNGIFESFKRKCTRLDDWKGTHVVLLIDEFSYIYDQILRGQVPEQFMKNWKALLQNNYFSAVLAGQDVMAKFKLRFPNEFGTTQDERVTYLRREDAVRLIDEPIRIEGPQGESRYRERAIERLLDLSAGSPFYIMIIGNRLVEYMNRKRARLVTDADVEQVTGELIRGANALGRDKFDNLFNSGDTSPDAISDQDALNVLTSIALNSRSGSSARHNISCETQRPLDVILDDLTTRDVIEKQGEYFRIRVGLLKEWLIAHH